MKAVDFEDVFGPKDLTISRQCRCGAATAFSQAEILKGIWRWPSAAQKKAPGKDGSQGGKGRHPFPGAIGRSCDAG
jgi:hypothetical protein